MKIAEFDRYEIGVIVMALTEMRTKLITVDVEKVTSSIDVILEKIMNMYCENDMLL